MGIEVIPVGRLQSEALDVLAKCCDSGRPVVVELPDHRRVAIHPLDPDDEADSLVDELLESSKAFRDLLTKSAASQRRPFVPGEEP
jgi:hypothetical protein